MTKPILVSRVSLIDCTTFFRLFKAISGTVFISEQPGREWTAIVFFFLSALFHQPNLGVASFPRERRGKGIQHDTQIILCEGTWVDEKGHFELGPFLHDLILRT